MRLLKVATCNLNQWAMDFDTNLRNIKESISRAKEAGAVIRIGPELEITGYGCEDHFLEQDTVTHAWECLKDILLGDWTENILCSIGMPIIHGGVRYNCQVFCLNRRILMIRPKMCLANDGNYREFRWFSAWTPKDKLIEFQIPIDISESLSQQSVPFGYGYIQLLDVSIAAETCEELFTANGPRIALALNGVEIFTNASGSHHQLRKLNLRMDAIRNATRFCGGVYVYSNHQGCDGGRLYYDGCSCIAINGDIVAQGSQFSLKDVEVSTAIVDLDAVSSYRGSISSFREQASHQEEVPSIKAQYRLCHSFNLGFVPSMPIEVRYHCPEEEIALGPSCWLWDYLRRSGASGFLLPLSGGADSSSVAAIVGCMSQLVIKDIQEDGDEQVKADALRIGLYKNGEIPTDSKEFAKRIFYTVYMGSENSSEVTRSRAKILADEIGSWHLNVDIDGVISALLSLFQTLTGKCLRYKVDGGSNTENLALQNIQARVRMVLAFMLASLMPWVHSKPGFFLVLGSSNVDEGLRGYLTKYDCSSADINPIGSVSKQDLRSFLRWASIHLHYTSLAEVEAAPPTAELEPIRSDYNQLDEVDMGMTYEELSIYGRLRKIFRCGPVSMFQNLCHKWCGRLTPSEVAEKVKHFFKYYSINRHKMTVLTPSYHAESYSPEDNRFDLRQFLYNSRWPYQFRKIDELVQEVSDQRTARFPEGLEDLDTDSASGSGTGVVAAGSSNPNAGI
ncbi:glutamine-dependent NAD(+) synthetase-like [Zingiber officinale]|uniref:glutamine-dependent NAD(+) synthetase-like n=1 Tax=Zingiber officinale TaxID=94328 RepID=UPI001C4B4556|nr:glutamine-dependent NAD(+) synthetase-like [Zingiber officinale]XP_042413862.1 glutamine-dependent NAD(+) synthetase-like [Zingiber officinale]